MSEGQPIGKELTSEHGLEEVAKGLAQGTVSRRKALGVVGSILGGSLLALIPGMALAQPQPPSGSPGRSFFPKCCREAQALLGDAFPYRNRGQCVRNRARRLDCDDCPETCENPPNGNNGECPYGEEQICVPECGEGQVGILLGPDNRECVEDPCDPGQELTIIADTVGGGIALRCE